MSRNYYSEIYLHRTWHTKDSRPLLTADVEPAAHAALRQRALRSPLLRLHALNGTENHVHLAVSLPPTVLISSFVGDLKGYSSHYLNQLFPAGDRFAWQTGYGVVSFGQRDLPWVVRYIERQKEHHAGGTPQERLERTDAEDEPAQVEQLATPG